MPPRGVTPLMRITSAALRTDMTVPFSCVGPQTIAGNAPSMSLATLWRTDEPMLWNGLQTHIGGRDQRRAADQVN